MEQNGVDIAKKTVAVLAALALAAIWYVTSYEPLKKSEGYIAAMNSRSQTTTLGDFEAGFERVLDMPSPIGQEELVRNFASIAINIITQYGKSNPVVVSSTVSLVNHYFDPIIAGGHGMSYTQNLFVLAGINQSAFLATQDPAYWAKAEQYCLQGIQLSPQRPQFLYGLFDLYRMVGNVPKVVETGSRILALWPNDDRVAAEIARYEGATSTTPQSP